MISALTERQDRIVKAFMAGVGQEDDTAAGFDAVLAAFPDASPQELQAALTRSAEHDFAEANALERWNSARKAIQ